MSHKKRKKQSQEFTRSLVTHRMNENLRDLSLGAERALRLRQFDHHKEFDDEFSARHAAEVPTRIDGTNAHIVERISGRPLSAASRFHDSMPEERLPPVHDYFQERPEVVSVCARREQRRSVLFALRRTRKGSGSGKKHNWTPLSKVRCV